MGSALGAALRSAGHDVLWASESRSRESAARADAAGLRDAGSPARLAEESELILSVCPPHAALDVVASVPRFGGVYVDANATSPATARSVGARAQSAGGRFVDGGIIGPPPRAEGDTRLYLSGESAGEVAALFDGTVVAALVIDGAAGSASALKMAYAAWSKGMAALLLAARGLARAEGVEAPLLAEWETTYPDLAERCRRAAYRAEAYGWRWVGEMEEIAAAMDAVALPPGFHRAAADVFGRSPRRESSADDAAVARVLDALLGGDHRAVAEPKFTRR